MPLLTRNKTHLIIGRIRVRRYHVKAALAYGGAALMAADATATILPMFWPHFALVLHGMEATMAAGGKCGAAASGCAAFFDRIIAAGIAEEQSASV